MNSRKKLLRESRVYVILNEGQLGKATPRGLADKVNSLNADIIQLRLKNFPVERVYAYARLLRKLCFKAKTLFIVNDYIDIAKIVDADGVHLGQDDLGIEIARKILGPDKIIGISTHSLFQARAAQNSGADYIGIGPVFPTPTKPQSAPIGLGVVRRVAQEIKIPFFAIGGINQKTVRSVGLSGAKRIAVTRAAKEVCEIRKILSRIKYKE